jgi:hypothetical protein
MKNIGVFITVLFFSFKCFSQEETKADSSETKVVYLMNGKKYIGIILSDDGREILIQSEKIGKIYIPKTDIKEINSASNNLIEVNGEIDVESPFTTRYAYTSNAFPIKKGSNYAMINLFGPEIHFATSDRFSIGVMTTWIGSPLAFNTKYSFKSKYENLNFSIGAILGTSGYLGSGNGYGGLSWLTTTYGNRTNNLSVSAGYGNIGFLNDISRNIGGPLFSIAGIHSVGKGISFIFDSMFSITKRTQSNPIYSDTPTTIDYGNGYIDTYYDITSYEDVRQTNLAFFLMPGMRFQKTDDKAFQISLAGVINIYGDQTNSFPVPMCTWLFKL